MKQHMQFHADQSPSVGPKLAIIAWYVVCAAAAAWLVLGAPSGVMPAGHPGRQAVLLACAALYVGRAAHTLFVPLGMACNFIFVIIPAHDAYLAEHYGEEFARYAERTKRLIPMVY
ncbi:MAG: hypothetical protein C0497_07705 [Gemmatimonas sp.]|nr:hypothetical protein [Gemmatimonas sp.]